MKKPFDFTNNPFNSVLQNSEAETIARNIMIILGRTGNKFRKLSWNEYVIERKKDGNFTEKEKEYFNKVIDYCLSSRTAKLFSSAWK